jgi:hypothetical protein
LLSISLPLSFSFSCGLNVVSYGPEGNLEPLRLMLSSLRNARYLDLNLVRSAGKYPKHTIFPFNNTIQRSTPTMTSTSYTVSSREIIICDYLSRKLRPLPIFIIPPCIKHISSWLQIVELVTEYDNYHALVLAFILIRRLLSTRCEI